MYFTVEEENLICLYHNADRRRTAGKLPAGPAAPTHPADKLDTMSDADFAAQRFHFTDE